MRLFRPFYSSALFLVSALTLSQLAAAFAPTAVTTWSPRGFVPCVSVSNAPTTSRAQPLWASKSKGDDSDGEDEEFLVKVPLDPLVKETSILLRRLSWLAWWAQLILTMVSSVTLLFARNVIGATTAASASTVEGAAAASTRAISGAGSLPNFVLAGSGVVFSLGSIFWTWATRRLARRLIKKPTTRLEAANMLRKSISVGVTINILGMMASLLSAEQIVGVLAIKVLTTTSLGASRPFAFGDTNLLQPLDILIVQANTNTLFSHFCSLVALLYLTKAALPKLEPPSRAN